jgi:hypothetical protein
MDSSISPDLDELEVKVAAQSHKSPTVQALLSGTDSEANDVIIKADINVAP